MPRAGAVLEVDEPRSAVDSAKSASDGLDAKGKARALHAILDDIAKAKGYCLRLRR